MVRPPHHATTAANAGARARRSTCREAADRCSRPRPFRSDSLTSSTNRSNPANRSSKRSTHKPCRPRHPSPRRVPRSASCKSFRAATSATTSKRSPRRRAKKWSRSRGGVNIVIQGLAVPNVPATLGPLGDIDIEADRVVIWGLDSGTGGLGQPAAQPVTQQSDQPLEIYMEGNIVFRQGDRTVYATRMFYDVKRQIGIILDAELLTPVPQRERLSIPRPHSPPRRIAQAARPRRTSSPKTASSRPAASKSPSYDLTGGTMTLTDSQQPLIDPATGQQVVNPQTGQPAYRALQPAAKRKQLPAHRRHPGLLLADLLDRPRAADVLPRQLPHPQRFRLRLPGAHRARYVPAAWATTIRRTA